MIEVEIKLPLRSLQETQQELENLDFFQGALLEESDIYFTSRFHDFKQLDEAMRIRHRKNLSTGKEENLLTYKGSKLDQVSMSRREIETAVGSAEKMHQIFTALGFTAVDPVVKRRQYYLRGDMTACLDRVENLGDFLELEILVPEGSGAEEGRKSALFKIEEILQKLGYSMEDTTRKSYLSQLQDRKE